MVVAKACETKSSSSVPVDYFQHRGRKDKSYLQKGAPNSQKSNKAKSNQRGGESVPIPALKGIGYFILRGSTSRKILF